VEIIRHRRQPGRDDAANVIAALIHHVEGHGGAKIHHHHRRAKMMAGRNRIRQPVGTNGLRLGIVDADHDNRRGR